jgi:uncharacterized protein (TIGR03546 family)
MAPRISKNSKRIVAVLSQHRAPSQIAWGGALGVVLAIIPKDNLVALCVIGVLAFCRVNQLVGCGTALLGLAMGNWLEPMTGSVGTWLLSQPVVVDLIQQSYRIPIVPWMCFENALVTGGLVVGLICMLPTYAICALTLHKLNRVREDDELRKIVTEAKQYRKSMVDQTATRREQPTQTLKIMSVSDDEWQDERPQTVQASIAIEEKSESAEPKTLSLSPRKEVAKSQHRAKRTSTSNPNPVVDHETSLGNETILRETVIEVVRYRKPKVELSPVSDSSTESIHLSNESGTPMAVANVSQTSDGNTRKDSAHVTSAATEVIPQTMDDRHVSIHTTNREESLKYLLSHIAGSRVSNRRSTGKTA